MKKDLNPINYLLPKNVDKKDSAIGIVLPFQIFTPIRITILLFYDYRTGRIERYSVNSSQEMWKWKNVNKDTVSNFSFKNNKYIINNKDLHSITDFTGIYDPILHDGKFSQKFYEHFINELLRDYIFSLAKLKKSVSFNYVNMDIIRALTRPYFLTENHSMGAGFLQDKEQEIIHNDNYFKLKNIMPFYPKEFITTDYNLNLLIHIPRKFENVFENADKNKKTIFKVLPIKDYSQGVIDLRRSLEIKTITSLPELEYRIRTFNHNIVEQLKKHEIENNKWIQV